MSMPFIVISCTACAFRGSSTVVWGQFSYEEINERIPIGRDLAWCASCNDMTAAEVVPTNHSIKLLEVLVGTKSEAIAELERDAASRRTWFQRLFGISASVDAEARTLSIELSRHERELADAKVQARFLSGRQSPPKCLMCGAVEFVRLPANLPLLGSERSPGSPVPIGMKHPGCSGEFIAAHSEIRISMKRMHRIYDREGNFVDAVRGD